jgi:hypothetical protein
MNSREISEILEASVLSKTLSVETEKSIKLVADYCLAFPKRAFSKKRDGEFLDKSSKLYWLYFSSAFLKGRELKNPKKTATIPDEMVSVILEHYFDVSKVKLNTIKVEHQQSMVAENLVGSILERYLATVLEPKGWAWCSGSVVKSVDFVKKDGAKWIALQVKNRSNSENSSSSKVRDKTGIIKWHRSNAKTGDTLWDKFPDKSVAGSLSEEGFREFLLNYLGRMKALQGSQS